MPDLIQFETLEASRIRLHSPDMQLHLRDWLVIYEPRLDDGLYGHTALHSLLSELNESFGSSTAIFARTIHNRGVGLLSPHSTHVASHAAALVAHIEAGDHPDPGALRRAREKRAAERWQAMETPDRVNWCVAEKLPAGLGVSEDPDESVIARMLELFDD